MRHHKKGTTSFGRLLGHKKALMNNLVKALLLNKRIETTLVRAKETGRLAEKLITYGKKDTVHSRRQAYKILKNRDLVKKLFDEIAPQYKNRNGGYTRVIKTGFRIGDAALTAIVEFVEEEIADKKKTKSKTDKSKTSKKSSVDKKKTEKPKTKITKKEEVEKVVEEVVVEPETEKVETPETAEPEIEEKQEDLEEAKEEVEEALNEEVAEEAPVEKEEEIVEEKPEEEKAEPVKEEKS
ncbi:MAG: 50S ribosomal protein L17 [Candidatus Celaenobacter antarcticus]|nr:50S ribosomal protein L17 [Candidatus Celaenobacter antarcticus]